MDQLRFGSRQVQQGWDCSGWGLQQALHLRVGLRGGVLHFLNVHLANWTWAEVASAQAGLAEAGLAEAVLARVV